MKAPQMKDLQMRVVAVSEQFFKNRNCPSCGKMHLTEDYFCEHCLCTLLDDRGPGILKAHTLEWGG